MSITNFKPLDSIEFCIWDNDDIRNSSALGRDTEGLMFPDLYVDSEPKKGGLIDARMGTTDDNIICVTCGLNTKYCVGHFGHITLETPVFNIIYIQIVKKILSCVCLKCSKILVHKNVKELDDIVKNKIGMNRLNSIKESNKEVQTCQNCGTPVSKIKLDSKKTSFAIQLIAEIKMDEHNDDMKVVDKKVSRILTAEDCYNILKNISDNDCILLGLNAIASRPESMIIRTLPVPPVPVRPSVRLEGSSSTREDDLTVSLANIVKANKRLSSSKEPMNKTSQVVQNISTNAQFLQYHVATYYDNDTSLMPRSEQKSGKSNKSLCERLKTKEGRFRNNLMGKRVDFSARTVITPDPSISINQVGVPIDVAMKLTFPEIVTPYNIGRLQELVKNGRSIYPGANYVIKKNPNGTENNIALMYRKDKIELHQGDVVLRHLNDTDIVLLNRQPTLHKQSMMGHYVHVIDDPTYASFRVNVGVTAPYNADYDGITRN
jgi:DNA-directed RNA polymerase II subunit RPB1